ncbi:MAG: response regulator [Acidobacteriota bacterium]|nr:response regulator [Acidobacteriota bacterium]
MASISSPRILCVEDNQDISGYIREMLKIAGYQAVVAENLIDGLRQARGGHFDLILLDYNLPDGTGLELCKLIRALDRQTPILFYSSATESEIRQAAMEAGAQGYIGKMEAFDILEQTITKLIESGGVKSSLTGSPASQVPASMFAQQDFDRFVERYNADFYFLLMRASTGQHDCLLTSFFVLKDLYAAINKLHEVGRFQLSVIPYPVSLRANEALLMDLGFDEQGIERIDSFLKFIKETQGRELEEIIEEGILIPCPKRSSADHRPV